jgi:hypothetical protein
LEEGDKSEGEDVPKEFVGDNLAEFGPAVVLNSLDPHMN